MRAVKYLSWMLLLGMGMHAACLSQEDRKPFKLALVQMQVIGGERDANLLHAGEMVKEAAGHGAQFVLLPEAMDLGWTDPSALTEAEPVPEGKTARFLSELAYMGADVILSPSSWAVEADHDNSEDPYGETWRRVYKPVATDFRVWIASCSNVGWMTGGPWKGWKGIGCSMVYAPGGEEVLIGPYGEDADTILYVDIKPEPRPAQGTTWHHYWNREKP